LNLLLDTHVALWAITDSPGSPASPRTDQIVQNKCLGQRRQHLGDFTIKRSLSRGSMPVSSHDALRYFEDSGYRLLPIDAEHAVQAETLPPHHQDPFDRILVAQALVEPMRLMTHAPIVARYGDTIMLV
jgi:PIN domain nuclease of toxin-antitoxin system